MHFLRWACRIERYQARTNHFILILLMILSHAAFAQTASLQPNEINYGDTTILIIEYDGKQISPDELDLAMLADDFEVLNNSSSFRMQQSGSKIRNTLRWEIELLPRKSGQLKIPSLSIDGNYTPPLTLTVKASSTAATNENIFIKVSAEPENPYLGQQTNIVVKLYYAIGIISGTLSEPGFNSADVHRLGADINYTETINGKNYEVLERSFAFFPSASGHLTMLPIVFRGQTEGSVSRRGSKYNAYLRPLKMTTRKSNEIMLDVRPKPAGYKGKYWLPANNVRLSQQWLDDDGVKKPGDAVNRTIKIIVDGLTAQALPQDLISSTLDINIYPDRPLRENQVIGKKLVGKLTQKNAMIFTRGGEIQSPQVSLSWWDIDEDIEKHLSLPARVFQIEDQQQLSQIPEKQTASPVINKIVDQKTDSHISLWQWLTMALFGLWLLTLFIWWYSKQSVNKVQHETPEVIGWDLKLLQQACKANDAVKARNELIRWAKVHWPNHSFYGLHQLIELARTDDFKRQLEDLDAVLFSSKSTEGWQGETLLQSFKVELDSDLVIKSEPQGLPPLYPS